MGKIEIFSRNFKVKTFARDWTMRDTIPKVQGDAVRPSQSRLPSNRSGSYPDDKKTTQQRSDVKIYYNQTSSGFLVDYMRKSDLIDAFKDAMLAVLETETGWKSKNWVDLGYAGVTVSDPQAKAQRLNIAPELLGRAEIRATALRDRRTGKPSAYAVGWPDRTVERDDLNGPTSYIIQHMARVLDENTPLTRTRVLVAFSVAVSVYWYDRPDVRKHLTAASAAMGVDLVKLLNSFVNQGRIQSKTGKGTYNTKR